MLLCLGAALPVAAQQPFLDSLKEALQKPQPIISEAQLLRDIAWELTSVGGESPEPYLLRAIKLSASVSDSAGLAQGYLQLGLFVQHNLDYTTAEELLQKALEIRQALHRSSEVASVYNNLGDLHRLQGDPLTARADFEHAMQIYRQLGDSLMVANVSIAMCNLLALLHIKWVS